MRNPFVSFPVFFGSLELIRPLVRASSEISSQTQLDSEIDGRQADEAAKAPMCANAFERPTTRHTGALHI